MRPCVACHGDGFVSDAPCGCREALCPHTPCFGSPEDETQGIYQKYWVRRTDESSRPGGKHAECTYFVLDWKHDPFAVTAARAYADACEAEYPELAKDLRAEAVAAERRWWRSNRKLK